MLNIYEWFIFCSILISTVQETNLVDLVNEFLLRVLIKCCKAMNQM